jgi:subtilisin family serine protease
MRAMPLRVSVLTLCLLALPALPTSAGPRPPIAASGVAVGPALDLSVGSSARYIVQLADAPLATYRGTVPGLAATAPRQDDATDPRAQADPAVGPTGAPGGRARLDVAAPSSVAYGQYLQARQQAFADALHAVAPAARPLYHYRVAFNGLAVRLTDAQAAAVRRLPGVVALTREQRVETRLDASLPQIAAPAAWAAAGTGGRTGAGRGVRIAIIDSGISPSHPMFADGGFRAPPGFPRASVTVGDVVTPYLGTDLARFTNNKVIVARVYANPETLQAAGGGIGPTQPVTITPLADVFHGEHVAGIAAGSVVTAGLGAGAPVELSGVAPGAYVMAYKFDNAYTPEILRMIDDAVADGADVINNSWGTAAMNVSDPDHHPVSQAFKAAAAAGVVVVAASGNSGTNGEATLGGPFQMINEVITVANVQTGRTFGYRVLAADTGLPSELSSHPAQNFALGNTFTVIEGAALASDLCNPIQALRARDKVVLMPYDARCDQSVITLPIELPDQLKFVQSLLTARFVGARGVVMYAPTAEAAAQQALVLQGLDLVVGQIPGGGTGGTQFEFPVTALIDGQNATDLVSWAGTHPSLRLTINHDPVAIPDPATLDAAHATSSQGPAPDGAHVILKPDLAAPGSDIRSANTAADGAPDGFAVATGTSMASPHVAGAAAVLRQVWPEWTPGEIKSALMITTDPVVTVAGQPAPASVQGSGRLNVGRAIDPGILIDPPSVDLGVRSADAPAVRITFRIADARARATGAVTYRVRHDPAPAGEAWLAVDVPAQVTVPAGGAVDLVAVIRHPGAPAGTYDGRIVLESAGHRAHVVYAVRVPGEHKDVLLVNVRTTAEAAPGPLGAFQPPQLVDTTDYAAYWTHSLDALNLTYDVWSVAEGAHAGVPPLSILRNYGLVIVAAGDGNAPLESLPGGMTSLQMYLLGGGRMLASGRTWNHGPASLLQLAGAQGNGLAYFLSRYFAGFDRTGDDVALTGPLMPVRVFDAPLSLSTTATDDAAGTGGAIDVGRPLAALRTASAGGMQATAPLDIGLAAPVAVEKLMPYMRTYLEVSGRGSAMTGVDADATLEHPVRADFIPWRALFAGFAVEAVADAGTGPGRAAFLAQVHAWAVEPDDVTVTVSGPDTGMPGAALTFSATTVSPSDVQAHGWRWDAGDGRPFARADEGRAILTFAAPGTYVVRAEVTTRDGHTYVAEKRVRVGGLFVPLTMRSRRR